MEHGGDLISYKNYYEGELVDYSSNINPLGVPSGLREYLFDNFHQVEAYPDRYYRKLRENIGEYLGCSSENILVGNGAMEIIDLFNLISKRVITLSPAFSEYSIRAKVHGKDYLELNYRSDFSIDFKELEDNILKDDLLILGNPNNPTGLRIGEEELLRIYDLIRKREAFLLLDEAFFEFVPEDYDSIEIFKKYNYERLGIIRAATKFFAIPGLRLGYGCSSPDLVEEIRSKSPTWSVNALAELAANYIFQDKEYIEESRSYIAREREFLLEELRKLEGIIPYETHTNYILIKLLNKTEDQVFEDLARKGYIVRKCSSFKVLGDNHIRIAIKDRKNNLGLIRALGEIEL